MIYFAVCLLLGFLIQRHVEGKKAYFISPLGAMLSSLVSILIGVFVIAPMLDQAVDETGLILVFITQTFWGTFLVAFAIWWFRRKRNKVQDEQPA